MVPVLEEIWVYLSAQPLLWLTATLLAYVLGHAIYERFDMNPLLNPVAIAVVVLLLVLWGTGTPYGVYFDGAQFVHFLLGPATVAIAVPLYQHLDKVRRALLPMTLALLAGSITAVVSAVGIAVLLGASPSTWISLAPKSVTTPVAMGIAEQLGGLPSLTAALVILTGILGAMTAGPLFDLLGIRDWRARGFAIGVASHGIGTARAFQVSEVAGTFSGIAMGLNAVATALLTPLLLWVLL